MPPIADRPKSAPYSWRHWVIPGAGRGRVPRPISAPHRRHCGPAGRHPPVGSIGATVGAGYYPRGVHAGGARGAVGRLTVPSRPGCPRVDALCVRRSSPPSRRTKSWPRPQPSVRITSVCRTSPTESGIERYVLVLDEEGGNRRLPIWVGEHEGIALAFALEGVPLPRDAHRRHPLGPKTGRRSPERRDYPRRAFWRPSHG